MYSWCAKSYIFAWRHDCLHAARGPGSHARDPCWRADTQPTLITGWTVRVTPASSQVIQTADGTTQIYTWIYI